MLKVIGLSVFFINSTLALANSYNLDLIFSVSRSINNDSTKAQSSEAYENYPLFNQNYNIITQAAQFSSNADRVNFYRSKCHQIDNKYTNQANGEKLAVEEKINLAATLGYRLNQIYDDSLVGGPTKDVTLEDIYLAIKTHGKAGVCRHAAVAVIELLRACNFDDSSIRQGAYYTHNRSAHIYVQVTTTYGTYSINWSEIVKEETDANTIPQMTNETIRNHGLLVEWYDKDNKQIGTSYTDEGLIIKEAIEENPTGFQESNLTQLGIKGEASSAALDLGFVAKAFRGDRGDVRVQGVVTSVYLHTRYNLFANFLPAESSLKKSFVMAEGFDLVNDASTATNKRTYLASDFEISHKQTLIIGQHLKVSALASYYGFGASIKADYLGDKESGSYGGISEAPLQIETTYEAPIGNFSSAPIILFNAGYAADFAFFDMDSTASHGKNVYDKSGKRVEGKFTETAVVLARTRFYASHSLRSSDDRSKYEIFFSHEEDKLGAKTTSFKLQLSQQFVKPNSKDVFELTLGGQVVRFESFYGSTPVYYYNLNSGVDIPVDKLNVYSRLNLGTSSEFLAQNKAPTLRFEIGVSLRKK